VTREAQGKAKEVRVFTIQSETEVVRLRFSVGNRYLLIGDGCEVWELPPGEEPSYGDYESSYVEWHPREAKLYVGQGPKLAIIAPTGKVLQTLAKACWKTSWVEGLSFSPDGDWLITFEPFQLTGLKRVRDKWQVKWSEKVVKPRWYSPGDSFEAVAPFPDNRRIVTLISRTLPKPKKGARQEVHGGYTDLFVQRDLATGKVLSERELSRNESPHPRLTVTPDGATVVGFRGRSVYAWPTDSADPGRKTTVAKRDVQDVALHPSGRWVLVAGNSPEVSVWDTRTWKSVRTFDWHIGNVQCVAFSSDGSLAAAGSDRGKVAIWDWDL
jgi:WD40 repeat protein